MDTSYWNAINLTGTALQTGVRFIPTVGGVLSSLVGLLWPFEKPDLWGQIKQQVEELIDQKLAQAQWQDVSNKLNGLQEAVNDYLALVQYSPDDVDTIRAKWEAVSTAFQTSQPSFQSPGSELSLLALFAQFSNLYISLLRDGVLFGASWGWTPTTVQQRATTLTKNVKDFSAYAQQYYQQGLTSIQSKTGTNYHQCQPFRAVNQYQREMTLTVLDLKNCWPYLDPQSYPNPISFYLEREIYSDPVGTCDDSKAINLPSPPKQLPCYVAVWKANFMDAVQVSYPPNGGPGGQTITPRMGAGGGDTNGGTFPVLGTNPIVQASGNAGNILNGMKLTCKNGTSYGVFGGGKTGQSVDGKPYYGDPYSFSYASEILSRIHINGQSNYYGCADSAVFGFKFDPNPTTSMAAAQLLYTSAPTPMTLESFAQSAKAGHLDQQEVIKHAKEEGWEAQRLAIQERRKAYYPRQV